MIIAIVRLAILITRINKTDITCEFKDPFNELPEDLQIHDDYGTG